MRSVSTTQPARLDRLQPERGVEHEPVSPMPPAVAQNRSGSLGRRDASTLPPAGVTMVMANDVVAQRAGAVVVLAVDVAAIAPPTVT